MKKKKMTKGTKRTILIYLLILVVFYIVIYVVPQVSDVFLDTYIAEYGTLEVKEETTCLFVRDEKVFTAGYSGKVKKLAEEGELIKKGASVVEVGSHGITAERKGIVSYYSDGLEATYTIGSLDTLTVDVLNKIEDGEDTQVRELSNGSIESGNPVFKISDNQKWYLVFWLKEESAEKYVTGNNVTVDFLDGDEEEEGTRIRAHVESVTKQEDLTRVILSCNLYYEDFAKYRVKECSIISSSSTGILLQTSSIVEEGGQKGVYVVDKIGNYNFTPVRILGSDGETTVVEKNYFYDADGYPVYTVESYNEILKQNTEKE